MNTNRQNNNNNRRRGRGNNNNNRSQNNNNRNGYDHQNRVDNRARGNAAQMLEKYKKLASDAQLNGDRVNGEYYLQFADHYFRVLADFRSRQEERQGQDGPRRERNDWQNDDGYEGEGVEASEGEDRVEGEVEEGEREDRGNRPRSNNREQGRNSERGERSERNNDRRPRRHHSEEAADEAEGNEGGIDLAILPPSIGISSDDGDDEPVELAVKPARKPRARRPVRNDNDEDVIDAAE